VLGIGLGIADAGTFAFEITHTHSHREAFEERGGLGLGQPGVGACLLLDNYTCTRET